MNDRNLEAELRAANPVSRDAVDAMALEAGEEEMLSAIAAAIEPQQPAERSRGIGAGVRGFRGGLRLSRRPIALVGSAAVAAVAFLVAFSTGGGPAGGPTTAAAGGTERLARVSPHVLLEGRGWRVEAASETHKREGLITFFRGARPQSVVFKQDGFAAAVTGLAELQWRRVPARLLVGELLAIGMVRIGSAPVLGSEAQIYSQNEPGREFHEYFAVWEDGGRALVLRGNYSSVDVLRKRLSALREVAADRWAAALEGEVVETKAGVSVQPPK